MIHDLYSEDMNEDSYESPEPAKEIAKKLNPVIEESQDYSITPSRIVQTNVKSPQREVFQPKISVIEASKEKEDDVKIDLNLSSNPVAQNYSSVTPKAFNQNEFFQQALTISQQPRRETERLTYQSDRKPIMQGAQIYRSKRDLGNRYNSIDENQFIKKGQEMVHQSFGADEHDLSKSFISAKKEATRMSVQAELNRSKDDPVLIDWNTKTTNADEKYTNRTNYRA